MITDLKELYNVNNDFHTYVDRFVRSHPEYTIEKALRCKTIKEVAFEYETGVNSEDRKHEVKTVW